MLIYIFANLAMLRHVHMIIDYFQNTEIIVVLTAVLTGCFVKGAIGFGLPLIATPIMMFVLPLPEVVATLALPITVANLFQIWLNKAHWRILRQFWPLVATSTAIMLLGAPIMMAIDNNFLGILIGLMILLHAALSSIPLLQIQQFSIPPKTLSNMIVPAGIASGIFGSLTSMYSFPSLQLMMMMRISKDDLNLLLGVFLSLGYIALWCGISNAGFPVSNNFVLSGLMIIPAILGQQIGHLARRRISEDAFRHIVHFALACAGITLMIRGLVNFSWGI